MKLISWLMVSCFAIAGFSVAQPSDPAAFTVLIVGPDCKSLPGVVVTMQPLADSSEKLHPLTSTTDGGGKALFSKVPAGSYTVKADLGIPYLAITTAAIKVYDGTSRTLNLMVPLWGFPAEDLNGKERPLLKPRPDGSHG